MEKQPAEIQERFINDIVTTHMKLRRWNERMLVVFTIFTFIGFEMLIVAVIKKDMTMGIYQALLTGMTFFFANEAYRRTI